MTTIKSVNCPTCHKEVLWIEAESFRPFCSKRCKLIDFGDWATEKNSIAGEPAFNEEEYDQ
ncbi:MAG: DNA gyrase inhibitor YacG [SAR86 cluster bacterium]|uniref:DNA gyrase inhibitor YacG n=1 Tax=SAR86 cluster bacterium TaxID=2030880 RepID=A0A2A4MIE3_9GAMM|nr:MAG: DNA gyrase inhibitor YacG [SAR86 cluster bacterium]